MDLEPEGIVPPDTDAGVGSDPVVRDIEDLLADGKLEEALTRARAVRDGADPRAEWLRDLTVYENYHEALCAALDAAVRGEFPMPDHQVDDPDISFLAYLAWCARQPETPTETWRQLSAGRYAIAEGVLPAAA